MNLVRGVEVLKGLGRSGECASKSPSLERKVISALRKTPHCTEWCKTIPACLNFRGLAPTLSNQTQPAKSAIFANIGGKTRNLAGVYLSAAISDNHSMARRQTSLASIFCSLMIDASNGSRLAGCKSC